MARSTKDKAGQTRQQLIDSARHVFHQNGVSRTSLDRVASYAGLTRGAIYWHFRDKAELFRAVRKTVLSPLIQEIESLINAESYRNPMDSVEAALTRLFQVVEGNHEVRAVLETITFRCEQADVEREAKEVTSRLQARLEQAYSRASKAGYLRAGLAPDFLAMDTVLFTQGLLARRLSGSLDQGAQQLVVQHIGLRRAG